MSKIKELLLFNGLCRFAGVVTALFVLTTLYAGNQVKDELVYPEIYPEINYQLIHAYEQAGDYTNALSKARDIYENLMVQGLIEKAEPVWQDVEYLEEKLLKFGLSKIVFNEDYQPRVKLLQLLELVGMEPLDKSLEAILQINNWAQKHLLRQGERWQAQSGTFETVKPKIMPLLKDLGFVDASFPHFKEYQGAIVHGGLLPRVRLRIHFLIEQWKQGVRFSHLYFLSGARPLEPQQESESLLIDAANSPLEIRKDWMIPEQLPKTECEMMQLVWDQSEIPDTLRKEVQVHFINAPMKKDLKSGRLLRPTTDDTVEFWLKESPPHGNYLAVTNAPYINRQDLVIRTLARGYGFETIGSGANDQEEIIIFLDELARYIYQAKQLFEN